MKKYINREEIPNEDAVALRRQVLLKEVNDYAQSEPFAGIVSDGDPIASRLQALLVEADKYRYLEVLDACSLLSGDPLDLDVKNDEGYRLLHYFQSFAYSSEALHLSGAPESDLEALEAARKRVSKHFGSHDIATAEKTILQLAAEYRITFRAARWLIRRALADYHEKERIIRELQNFTDDDDSGPASSTPPSSSLFHSKNRPTESPDDFFHALSEMELSCLSVLLNEINQDETLSDVNVLTEIAHRHGLSAEFLINFSIKLRQWRYHGSLQALSHVHYERGYETAINNGEPFFFVNLDDNSGPLITDIGGKGVADGQVLF